MTCPDCTASAAGLWHAFTASCPGCCARSVSPKYFDIACRRIEEAQRQQPLIPHEMPKQEQEALL